MKPEDMLGAALEMAQAGLTAGELPIGAVVVMGEEVVGRAFTQEKARGRRLAHADVLAMIEADEALGWRRRPQPLRLAVSLEPCVMCGRRDDAGVRTVYFGLESPGDGGTEVAAAWRSSPDTPWFTAPEIVGGIRREESQELFRRYCAEAPESGMRRWAQTLVDQAS
ncbi:deaminase [Micromonospora chersina]|uniref:deaminase n=1 Tax=Micromonospora chersina TaxID=47854 RepID=UPI0037B621A9